MKIISITECQRRLGKYLETVRTEPVFIEKTGRPVAVLISRAEYDRLTALENAYWLERAKEAEAGGYVGSEEAMALLKEGMEKAEA